MLSTLLVHLRKQLSKKYLENEDTLRELAIASLRWPKACKSRLSEVGLFGFDNVPLCRKSFAVNFWKNCNRFLVVSQMLHKKSFCVVVVNPLSV